MISENLLQKYSVYFVVNESALKMVFTTGKRCVANKENW